MGGLRGLGFLVIGVLTAGFLAVGFGVITGGVAGKGVAIGAGGFDKVFKPISIAVDVVFFGGDDGVG